MNDRTIPNGNRTALGAGGAFAAAVAFAAFRGSPGLAAGAALLAAWYVLAPMYAFAFGHVALGALFPDGIGTIPFAAIEAGLVGVLIEPAVRFDRRRRLAGLFGGCFLALGALTWGSYRWSGTAWAAAIVLLGTVALTAYAVHRYEVVTFGLARGTNDE